MRKIKAAKPIDKISVELLDSLLVCRIQMVFHEVKMMEEAVADDGPVSLVYLSTKTDYRPNSDVACLLYIAVTNTIELPRLLRTGVELWYWYNQFWIKGVNKLGDQWYQRIKDTHCYALYPLDIANSDKLLVQAWLNHGNTRV